MGTRIPKDDLVARKAKGMWRVVFRRPKAGGATDPARHGGFEMAEWLGNTLHTVSNVGSNPAFDKNQKTGSVTDEKTVPRGIGRSLIPYPSGNGVNQSREAEVVGKEVFVGE
jgi:hypothetical protein